MGADTSAGAIGPYEILRQLPGQSREIYVARPKGQAAGRVVVATFQLRAEDARWLEEEVERCKQLDHEAITRIVEVLEHDGKHVVVFEAVRGAALATVMAHLAKEGERLADHAVHYLGEMLFGALAAAHHQTDAEGRKTIPLVHGQLGPHQVFVSWEGEVKLLGFGLSRVFRLAQGLDAVPPQARPFLAPEVKAGAASSTRSNVYTAGAMLWSLYSREQPPDDVERLPLLRDKRPDLPRQIAEGIDQALEPLVVRRGITASELAKTFAGHAGSEGRRELRWNVEVLRSHDAFADGVPLSDSFPPAGLSDVPRPQADDEASESQRNPALPAPPAMPADSIVDEPTAALGEDRQAAFADRPAGAPSASGGNGARGQTHETHGGSGAGAGRAATAPPRESGSAAKSGDPSGAAPSSGASGDGPESSGNQPTGQWQIPGQTGMNNLFAAVGSNEIDEATAIEPLGTEPPAAPPARPTAGRDAGWPMPPPPAVAKRPAKGQGPNEEGAKATREKRARGRTLAGMGSLGAWVGDEAVPQERGKGVTRPAVRTPGELDGKFDRSTLPAAGVKLDPPPQRRSGWKTPAAETTDPRQTQPGVPRAARNDNAKVLGRAGRRASSGGIGPPAVERQSPAAMFRRSRDPRVDDSEPPVGADTTEQPHRDDASRGAFLRSAAPRRNPSGTGFGLPPPPEPPKVLVVPEAVRPSARPPAPAGAPGGEHATDDETSVPVVTQRPGSPVSVRPRAPRSRASRLRSHAEGPVSGRLVSVRPRPLEGPEAPAEPSPTAPAVAPTNPFGIPDVERLPPASLGAPYSHIEGAPASVAGAPLTQGSPGVGTSDAPTVTSTLRTVGGLVPTRWAMFLAGSIAVTAIVSFAAGLLVGSGPLDVRVAGQGANGPGGTTSSPTASGPPPTQPTVAPSSTPTAGAAAPDKAADPDDARPSPSATGDGSESDGDDGSALPSGFGYLLVRSSAEDAHVYVSGAPVGPTGKKALVRCGMLHVRLGSVPLREWLSAGKPVSVVCQGVTSVVIEPGKRELSGPGSVPTGTSPGRRFVPDDL